jgi:lipid-binding SYLF domain-containing protein
MQRRDHRFLATAAVGLFGFGIACHRGADAPDQARAGDHDRALEELRETTLVLKEMSIPKDQRDKARCVVVVPSFLSGGLLLGARHGRGVVACRTDTGWSGPAFVTVSGGSAGLQAGFESADVVMLVTSERGVGKLFRSSFELGGDTSVAAGPSGTERQASTDETMTSEIVTYARARGLFAGVQLTGAVVRQDRAAALALYGGAPTIQTILVGGVAPPTEAGAFVQELQRAF